MIDHSYQGVAKTPVEEFEVISIGDDSDVPSWVKMSSYKGIGDNWGLNWDSKVDQIPSQEEDCIIVPLCTIQEISSSKETSIQGQQNITSNSWVSKSASMPTVLEMNIVYNITPPESSLGLFKIVTGITSEPSKLSHKSPILNNV